MRTLEPHDELGLPWDDWADGDAHMLTRGRDFYRNPEVVLEAAKNAARRLDRAVTVLKEPRLGRTFMWVQFLDHQIELGRPCVCGSRTLLQINGQIAECPSCRSTLLLVKPKQRPDDADTGFDEAAEALLRPLFRYSGPPPKQKGARPPRVAPAITNRQWDEQSERARQADADQAKQRRRGGFNEHAAIVLGGAFTPEGDPITRAEAGDELEICTLMEFSAKHVDVRFTIVLTDPSDEARYRLMNRDPIRIGRPGRYTVRVKVPPGTLAEGEYTARASTALLRDDQFGRVTRRAAFSLEVGDGGGVDAPPGDPILLDDLEWVVEQGDGPWASARPGPV